jgi:hypothetical protein
MDARSWPAHLSVDESNINCWTQLRNAGRSRTVLGIMRGEVVAIASFAASVDLATLRSNFAVDQVTPLGTYPAEACGLLEACVINPVFEPHAAAWLSAVMQHMKQQVVYLAVAPGSAPPPCAATCMSQVAPRRPRRASAQESAAARFSLFSATRSLSLKPPVHSRVSSNDQMQSDEQIGSLLLPAAAQHTAQHTAPGTTTTPDRNRRSLGHRTGGPRGPAHQPPPPPHRLHPPGALVTRRARRSRRRRQPQLPSRHPGPAGAGRLGGRGGRVAVGGGQGGAAGGDERRARAALRSAGHYHRAAGEMQATLIGRHTGQHFPSLA